MFSQEEMEKIVGKAVDYLNASYPDQKLLITDLSWKPHALSKILTLYVTLYNAHKRTRSVNGFELFWFNTEDWKAERADPKDFDWKSDWYGKVERLAPSNGRFSEEEKAILRVAAFLYMADIAGNLHKKW